MPPLSPSWGTSSIKDCMEMDPTKVSAVTSWPIPNSRKQLQRFLGFANFYQRVI